MRAEQLLSEIGDYRCPKCGILARWRLCYHPEMRLNSTTAIAACGDCGRSIFLKRILTSNQGEEQAPGEHEFAIATQIYDQFPHSADMGVLAPLHRVGALLVFEYVAGESPIKLLRNTSVTEASALMRQLGEWFVLFHQVGGYSEGAIDFADKFANISKRSLISPPPQLVIPDALTYLESALPTFERRMVMHCRLHGDAKPDNFLVQGKRLIGIDIDGRCHNPPEYDLAQFLSQNMMNISRRFGVLDERRLQETETAFLEGYRRGGGAIDAAMLAWLRVYFLLNFWLSWRGSGVLRRLMWDKLFARGLKAFLHRVKVE